MIGPHDHTGPDTTSRVFTRPYPSSYGFGFSKIASLARFLAREAATYGQRQPKTRDSVRTSDTSTVPTDIVCERTREPRGFL